MEKDIKKFFVDCFDFFWPNIPVSQYSDIPVLKRVDP